MKKLLILALLSLPAAAYSQELNKADLEGMPGVKGGRAEAVDNLELVPRPDTNKIMGELSTALRLSSKQEMRINAAVAKKTAAFNKIMKEFEKNSSEEKKWRYKMNANRYEMVKINRNLPDLIREFLDDEQRQSYDEMLENSKKKAALALERSQAEEDGGAKSEGKKRLVKRKKVPAGAAAGPSEEQLDDESMGVMVDKDVAPAPKKKKVLKKKAAPKAEPAAADEPAGAAPTGKEAAPEEEDAGSYP